MSSVLPSHLLSPRRRGRGPALGNPCIAQDLTPPPTQRTVSTVIHAHPGLLAPVQIDEDSSLSTTGQGLAHQPSPRKRLSSPRGVSRLSSTTHTGTTSRLGPVCPGTPTTPHAHLRNSRVRSANPAEVPTPSQTGEGGGRRPPGRRTRSASNMCKRLKDAPRRDVAVDPLSPGATGPGVEVPWKQTRPETETGTPDPASLLKDSERERETVDPVVRGDSRPHPPRDSDPNAGEGDPSPLLPCVSPFYPKDVVGHNAP